MGASSPTGRSVSNARRRELERLANKSKAEVGAVSFLLGPLGYALLGKWALAVLCLVTLNWFLLGWVVVPIHAGHMIDSARRELDHLERLEA